MILTALFAQTKDTVNPWTLMAVGMGTVFIGLIILNLFINSLKKIFNRDLHVQDSEDKASEDFTKDLLKNIVLTDDEVLAVSLAIAIEYDLYYAYEPDMLTINSEDRLPIWALNKE